MAPGRKALVVATYAYADRGLSRLAAPAHDAESFASVLEDPAIAGFDVTMLVNEPHYVVGEAIADFYAGARRDDLTLLYFTGHGVKDDEGRLYLAMNNTRREALMFTAISAAQLNDAMDASTSRRKVLILDCCYSGAFPAGRTAKSDEGVQTLERFQGKGRAVLTASDATQYAFEGEDLTGSGTSSVFTRHLVEAISSGAADLDEDGDIALDELYSYVYEQVVAEVPQQRPKKQEDVDGRIVIARNVNWTLPAYLRHAIDSPIAAQRLGALQELEHLHVVGNGVVRAAVGEQVAVLASDDSRSVSTAATALLERLGRPG
ncbi:MAG TPA: caspase family protein, partial [Blastococcus sp.]